KSSVECTDQSRQRVIYIFCMIDNESSSTVPVNQNKLQKVKYQLPALTIRRTYCPRGHQYVFPLPWLHCPYANRQGFHLVGKTNPHLIFVRVGHCCADSPH